MRGVVTESVDVTVARHEERLAAIESGQKQINASVDRIGGKIDELRNWAMGVMASFLVALLLFVLAGFRQSPVSATKAEKRVGDYSEMRAAVGARK